MKSHAAVTRHKKRIRFFKVEFPKILDRIIDVHIITVRWFFHKKNEANVEVAKRPICIKTKQRFFKVSCLITLDRSNETHIIIIRQSILADLVH